MDKNSSSDMHDLISGIRDLLRKASNHAQNIDTILVELDTIRTKYKGETISKGDYDIDGRPGTIYTSNESKLLKDLLGIKTEYWNPNWDFISWEELFSKINRIESALSKLNAKKSELEDILLDSSKIASRLDSIFKYI